MLTIPPTKINLPIFSGSRLKAGMTIWNHFWFAPTSPKPIALFRIFFGLLLITNGLFLAPELFDFFGPDGIISLKASQAAASGLRINLFSLFPDTSTTALVIFSLYLASACTLTLGLWTRVSAALVFIAMVSLHTRNMLILNSGDTLMRVTSFLLIFSQAGAAYSLDCWRKGGEVLKSSPWGQRLIQYQFTMVYLMGVWWKLVGLTWINGTALYYVARLDEFTRFPVGYVFEHMWTIKLLTYGTLLVEFALGTLIWSKKYRYYVLAAGVALHLGIEYTMNIQLFEWLMLSFYVIFVDPADLERALNVARDFFGRSLRSVQRLFGFHPEEGQV